MVFKSNAIVQEQRGGGGYSLIVIPESKQCVRARVRARACARVCLCMRAGVRAPALVVPALLQPPRLRPGRRGGRCWQCRAAACASRALPPSLPRRLARAHVMAHIHSNMLATITALHSTGKVGAGGWMDGVVQGGRPPAAALRALGAKAPPWAAPSRAAACTSGAPLVR